MESAIESKGRLLSQFFTQEIAQKAGCAAAVSPPQTGGNFDPRVCALDYDSRNVRQGSLFFALPGSHTDGSLYIDDAVKKGAAVIVHENDITEKKDNVVYLKVKNARFAMSPVSASFFNFPSRDLLVTGVTGTEGKSTVTFLIWQLLSLLGKKAGFISTVQSCLGGEVLWNPEHQTTPEAPVVQRLLREMADNGCEYAVLESSSHGLSPKTNRLGDVEFFCGVLTNVTHDHLEFHGTWEQYRDDKANLFRALDKFPARSGSSLPFGVVNADDKSSDYFINASRRRVLRWSARGGEGDIILESIDAFGDGSRYSVFIPALNERFEIADKLPGAFNAANVLAALLAVCGLLNIPVREAAAFVKELKPVKGRMTPVKKGQPFEVVVDFAHTPSSFTAVFPPLRLRQDKTGGRIISLFGSAGERDTAKRPQQGRAAALYSDIIFITDEDPRSENSMDILEEIAAGVFSEQTRTVFKRDENVFLIPNRPSAIRKAFAAAQKGDLVILLGKGHENSIIYADHAAPFDEIDECAKALAEMGFH